MLNEESAFEREFAVRYRLPRPMSRSYESILYARDRAEIANKIEWCAGTAVRFVAALRQALHLAVDPASLPGPPGVRDFKLETGPGPFATLGAMPAPVLLLQHAGLYAGTVDRDSRSSLLESLEPLAFLRRYRIACRERGGIRVLLGQRMEYFIWSDGGAAEFDEGTPLLVDALTGDYCSLRPLVVWRRDSRRPLGSLLVLRSAREATGRYVEDGVPGSPGIELPLEGRPRTGAFAAGDPALALIRDPGVRYPDGMVEGEYAVMGVIWKGSMSDIYAAWNRRRNDPVILKTFERRGAGFDENYWHFVNEEKYAGAASHPGVVRPARIAREGMGLVYEEQFADGGSLSDVMEDRGVMPLERAVAVAAGLLGILVDVHARGIAHNDIKPDNILFDGAGRVRLIDFGIAWDFLRDRAELRGGVRVGSEGYIAPELMEGGAPSARSDIFSFGVVFAQMLGGRAAATAREVAGVRSIPRQLHPFFERCLARDPGGRFASAGEALAVLAGISAVQERAITLDIEGTLVTDYGTRHPRPGLAGFIGFCLRNFQRIFVYTSLTAGQADEVFDHLVDIGAVPGEFRGRYEYVEWPRGADGTIKDLRRCGFPIEYNAIVDDMEMWIPDDQRHRWIPVPGYGEKGVPDSGFYRAIEEIRSKFGIT